MDQLAQHGEYGPKVLAKAARLLQSRRGQGTPVAAEEPAPDIPITDAQGTPTGEFTYSAKQLKKLREDEHAAAKAEYDERIAPLEQAHRQTQTDRQIAHLERTSHAHAQETLAELRQQPHFKTHEPAIKQALIDHPEWGDNVHRAYVHVLTTTVMPGLTQSAQTQVLDHLQTQAAGASVHPGAASASGPPKFKSFGEAARYYAEHPADAEAMA